jgi:hypothetical protein
MAVRGAMSLVPSTTAGRSPPNVVHGHLECAHQRASVLAEALLARDQAVAVVLVLHLALLGIVGESDCRDNPVR